MCFTVPHPDRIYIYKTLYGLTGACRISKHVQTCFFSSCPPRYSGRKTKFPLLLFPALSRVFYYYAWFIFIVYLNFLLCTTIEINIRYCDFYCAETVYWIFRFYFSLIYKFTGSVNLLPLKNFIYWLWKVLLT